MTKTKILRLPNPSKRNSSQSEIEHSGKVVIVGANGSGKSRLGAWLENPLSLRRNRMPGVGGQATGAYRIGAQRVLAMPDQAKRQDPTSAINRLVGGSGGMHGLATRVSGDPVVGQSNDFEALLDALFADSAKHERDYRELGLQTGGQPGKPARNTLEKLTELWAQVYPHRRLILGDHTVQASDSGGKNAYSATQLSDGERVGFYLMGQVLLAPNDSLIVIDEPELHLHQSIQSVIWRVLGEERKDCSFVFLTHDLGFAASEATATKIVLYDYVSPVGPEDIGKWVWDVAPTVEGVPEEIVLRILGSRRPTLFVEGRRQSLDRQLYGALYPEKFIVPSDGSAAVHRATGAFKDKSELHHFEVCGIVDLDDRQPDEVAYLRSRSVSVLPVACAENMLLLPQCIEAYFAATAVPDMKRPLLIKEGASRVAKAINSVKDGIIAERAQQQVRKKFGRITRNGNACSDLRSAVNTAFQDANVEAIFAATQQAIEQAIADAENSLDGILRLVRNKAIIHEFASALGVSAEKYAEIVLNCVRQDSSLRAKLQQLVALP